MFLISSTVGILAEWAIVFTIARLSGSDVLLPVLMSITLAGMSLSIWADPKNEWISTPKGCFKALGMIPLVGALVFCIDMILGQIFHPLTNPFTAALNTGMFGGAATLATTVLGEMAALGSLVRAVLRQFSVSRPT